MDGSRFDQITRRLAGTRSRRGLLGGLTAIVAGVVGTRSTEAQSCPPDQVSRRGIGCVCRATGRPAPGGGCPCRSDEKRCAPDAACVAVNTCCDACCDDADCAPCAGSCLDGSCTGAPVLAEGVQCAPGRVCVDGACTGSGACTGALIAPCAPSSCNGTSSDVDNFCSITHEGGHVCVANDACGTEVEDCVVSADCPAGHACLDATGCGPGSCLPVCGGSAEGEGAAAVSIAGGGVDAAGATLP